MLPRKCVLGSTWKGRDVLSGYATIAWPIHTLCLILDFASVAPGRLARWIAGDDPADPSSLEAPTERRDNEGHHCRAVFRRFAELGRALVRVRCSRLASTT
jgi:hypothetical protein